MRAFPRVGVFATLAVIVAMAGVTATVAPTSAQPVMTTPSGLKIIDTKVGTGPSPKPGQTVIVHYTGWLYDNGAKGAKFDSSLDRSQPFEFPIGQHQVIPAGTKASRP